MKMLSTALRFPPSTLRMASTDLASGRQIGMVTGTTKAPALISMGHSRHRAVETPGLPHAKRGMGDDLDFLICGPEGEGKRSSATRGLR